LRILSSKIVESIGEVSFDPLDLSESAEDDLLDSLSTKKRQYKCPQVGDGAIGINYCDF
jgi:hypothetical protein